MPSMYFPWAAVLAFAVIALFITRFAHRQAHVRHSHMQAVIFQQHYDKISDECYRQLKSMSTQDRLAMGLLLSQESDEEVHREIVRFARTPGMMHQENYELLYTNGRLVHVRSRYGRELEVCSNQIGDLATTVMKLHYLLRDYQAKHPPGPG